MLRFDRLQTPPGDGDLLIEPCGPRWAELLAHNLQLLSHSRVTLAGTPLDLVRGRIRRRLLGDSPDGPVIAAGHQPEFVHSGVWAKHVVVHHVAAEHGITGLDLVVDNDAPKNGGLRIPHVRPGGELSIERIPFTRGPGSAAWEGRRPLAHAEIDALRKEVARHYGQACEESLLPGYLDAFARAGTPRDIVTQHIAGREAVDATLGADLVEARVSDAFGGSFVAELLIEADRFAACYNRALSDYRREHAVRGANRPLPDLVFQDDKVESPFWIYQPRRRRGRLWTAKRGDRLQLFADGDRVGEISVRDLRQNADEALGSLAPWVIRPRALTLTLWARLLVCDLFVHGIGGAKYDRMTDAICRTFFHVEPPAYTCVSATLRLSLPRYDVDSEHLARARRRRRDLRYNPQRYIPDMPEEVRERRSELIARADALRREQGPRFERRENFIAVRRLHAGLVEQHPELARGFDAECDRVRDQIASNRIADDREFFYALQPRARLAALADRLRSTLGLSQPRRACYDPTA